MELQLKCIDLWHAGSAEGVQAAVWVRLKLLLPLLPLVYADPEPDSNKNMRVLLAKALMPVMASPLVYQHLRCTPLLPSAVQALSWVLMTYTDASHHWHAGWVRAEAARWHSSRRCLKACSACGRH